MDKNVSTLVRSGILFLAEMAFLGLVISFVWRTVAAKSGLPPDLPTVQVSAAGALAVALGGGFAVALGVSPTPVVGAAEEKKPTLWDSIKSVLSEKLWLSLGVVAYIVAGAAACVVYGLFEAETPGILKTIAVGFGGYVIAYIGAAYRQLS